MPVECILGLISLQERKKRKEGSRICLIKERKIVNKVTTHGLDDRHCVFRHKCQLKVQNKKCGLTLATKKKD